MSIFDMFKYNAYTQNPQNSQYSTLPNKKSNFESSESIEGKDANVEKHKAQQKFPHKELLRKHSTQNSQYSRPLHNYNLSYKNYGLAVNFLF